MHPIPESPVSVRALVAAYGLRLERSNLWANNELFVKVEHDDSIAPPSTLPSLIHEGNIYFLVPKEIDLPQHWDEANSGPKIPLDIADAANVFVPQDDEWPEDKQIIGAVDAHRNAVFEARSRRQAIELLEREHRSELYASAAPVEDAAPMLIEGLMRERGVSVVFGDFDEFKTTLVLDMMAHVAMGAPWQGRRVSPRPVIWYALEGKDEIPVRLRAIDARLKTKGPAWGDDKSPITVLDRIPENDRAWRAEVGSFAERWYQVHNARAVIGELPTEKAIDGHREEFDRIKYPSIDLCDGPQPVLVIDTLSMALGGEDEKGAGAVGFVSKCIDLTKERPDLAAPSPKDRAAFEEWERLNPGATQDICFPVASHIILIHHQTKTGTDFAGHRAIGANTHGLYRVHRFGSITDAARPYAGQLTPQRVKGIPRPAPIRFEVEIVSVEGTKQTAAILKDKAEAVPDRLVPIIEALRAQIDDGEDIERSDLNVCLDIISKGNGNAQRVARKRNLEALSEAGILEPLLDDVGKVVSHRFHDPEGL